jgi:hypothetical protein
MNRNPSPTNPLDCASFYIEELKYGDDAGILTPIDKQEAVAFLEALLRDAKVSSITGAELDSALDLYAGDFARMFGLSLIVAKTIFVDGLAHGIALAAGLEGHPRDPLPR